MDTPLARKLRNFVPLTSVDLYLLSEILEPARIVEARADIVEEGEDPRAVNVVVSGWACRYRQFEDGQRQIISILLPGDCCDPHIFRLDRRDHAIGALTQVSVARIAGHAIADVMNRSAALDLAFHREALAAAAIQREWTVSLGRRSGVERLAHLCCEFNARLTAVARLLALKSRRLTILHPERLRRLAKFDPAYLHLRAADDAVRRIETIRP